MFKVNDYVMKANHGVCRIKDIVHLDMPSIDKKKRFYYLVPVDDENMKVYAVAGGNGENCELGTSFECPANGDGDNRFYQRNGMITITIDNNGYEIESEYNGSNLIEMKDTDFYKANKEALNK